VLSEPVSVLAEHDPRRTDILHEYFLGPANLAAFLDGCRTIILASRQELLNITLRFVAADRESALAYARTDCIGAVMSFSQQKTAEAEADMQAMTRTLIDCVLGLGGSFYLPYRLHATRCQIAASYPALEDFIALKRRYDPHCLFRNALWDRLI
jgi:FAD/FMN-containing dehydrogenase